MKMFPLGVALVTAFGAGIAAHALADYTGPGSDALRAQPAAAASSVAEVLKAGRDDQQVTLAGHIVRQLGPEQFLFRDASGEIAIEIDDDAMPAQAFNETTPVQISGEIEKEAGKALTLEVDKIALR